MGYTALHRQVVGLDNVYDPEALARFPGLRYDSRYESHAGVRVKSLLSIPLIEHDTALIGILQLVNTTRPIDEYTADLDFLVHLGKMVASAVFHHDERQRRATKFDFLLEEGLVSPEELTGPSGQRGKMQTTRSKGMPSPF